MVKNGLYLTYAESLAGRYGEKVYKIPISIPTTCPNRDGNLGHGGCDFCGEKGAGHETLSSTIDAANQYEQNKTYIQKKYKAKKFIPYLQDFTNTYLSPQRFRDVMNELCREDVVEFAVSTRPDCILKEHLDILQEIKEKHGIDTTIELGVQTVNYKSLQKINRGHTLAEVIDAANQIKAYGFRICAHMILNLPWDDSQDAIEGAKILSALKVDDVKLHALYIEEGTRFAQMYRNHEFDLISLEEYIERVRLFLEYLDPKIAIQRLIGRAPKEDTLFVNWNTGWWKIRDQIESEMKMRDSYQGKHYDYLDGKAHKNRKFV
ncbi:MAG TPA: TIGR01212 family radical SAM protein [Eubacteriaceae bacterium]|nr:TIGR01212 family radical SAM protein [Eubacteriaceae bacterium]